MSHVLYFLLLAVLLVLSGISYVAFMRCVIERINFNARYWHRRGL